MLGWAVTFLIVALVAALLGFGGIAGVAVEAAKIVFFVAILLLAISVIAGLVRGRPTVPWRCSALAWVRQALYDFGRAGSVAVWPYESCASGMYQQAMSFAAACEHRASRFVGAEIFSAVDVEQFGQACARSVDA